MSRANPDLVQGFTGISLPRTGPRQMGTDAEGRTAFVTFLNQFTESISSLHDNQTNTRPPYLPVNGMWCYTSPDGTKTVYQYDGVRDAVLWTIKADGTLQYPLATSTTPGIVQPGAGLSIDASGVVDVTSGNFSTTEQWTGGYWIDGKKIYRKVVDCGALPGATSKVIPHNISNFAMAHYIYGVGWRSGGASFPIPFAATSPGWTAGDGVAVVISSTGIIIYTGGGGWPVNSAYITLEYTKTTD